MISAIGEFVLLLILAIVILMLGSLLKWRLHRRHITLRKHGRKKP